MFQSSMKKTRLATAIVSLAIGLSTGLAMNAALAAEGKLVIVTSFPTDTTETFKAAFEKANPGIEVEMLRKKTTAGIKYLQETSSNNTSDMFWASAPDAFEVLKDDDLLVKYESSVPGIPDKVGSFPINDPEGYYKGFAASGYGIMWNERYMQAKKIPIPAEWADLKKPIYNGHVGVSAPSRSGTTHLTIETVLQGMGWDAGWAEWKYIAGNLKTITERSFGVPDGVNSGQFGVGIVIDFFGLSSEASGFPVKFAYPTVTTLVPANIAIVKNAPNSEAAGAFIDYLLSEAGQQVLLNPKIRRLPVNPSAYAGLPDDFPNPFKDSSLGAEVKFDLAQSKNRYNVVNSLFDVMITYRLENLQEAVTAVQEAEAAMEGKTNADAAQLIAEARAMIEKLPISESEASEEGFNAIFKKKRKKSTDVSKGRQAEIEREWDDAVKANYASAVELANKAKSML